MATIIVLGSSAATPFPRTKTNQLNDYLDITTYQKHFELHDDLLCVSAARGGKDRRTRSCAALVLSEGVVLFDTGPDIRYQLEREDVKPDAVFVTHDHADANYGLRFLSPDVRVFSEKTGTIRPGRAEELFGATITPFRVQHTKDVPCVGYRVNIGQASFAYATDFSSEVGLREAVANCDVFFADGSILHRSFGGHMAIDEQLALYKDWGLKRVIFTHIGHATLPHEELVHYIRGKYPHADVAYDGMRIDII